MLNQIAVIIVLLIRARSWPAIPTHQILALVHTQNADSVTWNGCKGARWPYTRAQPEGLDKEVRQPMQCVHSWEYELDKKAFNYT